MYSLESSNTRQDASRKLLSKSSSCGIRSSWCVYSLYTFILHYVDMISASHMTNHVLGTAEHATEGQDVAIGRASINEVRPSFALASTDRR